ncbi:MAG: DNA repair protein RadA [Rhodospirillales bacterium]|nr:DNA repair protein RadA [Rhodospirillales bacterium]
MAKRTARFVCQSCGAVSAKWSGRCEACAAWNSIVEEAPREAAPGGLGDRARSGHKLEFVGLDGGGTPTPRLATGIGELDRVCGGGLIAGSAILIGGDPGIGKSTILLQMVAALASPKGGAPVTSAYISGEESVEQIGLRARRLGLAAEGVGVATATSVRDIVASLDEAAPPRVVVIDSIQTLYLDTVESAPGTVSQVRGSAQELIRLAKRRGFTLVLVGHVTKEGALAGPKVLEHMVDTVLYFEGERGHQFRILRAVKNRFGPTDEIGVFEMTDGGLMEVANPSALFLAERRGQVSGAAVLAGMEGSRPVLVEIQALVSPSPLGTPRRAVVGWDSARLAMVLAVLEARCGLVLSGRDVYLNVAGGLRIGEPAADLAVAAALVSAASGDPVPEDMVIFGEIGLSGEVRAVSQSNLRLKEAAKLGFARTLMPPARGRREGSAGNGIERIEIAHLKDLVARFADTAAAPTRFGIGPAN